MKAMIEAAVERNGRLDCMVNNAGIAGRFGGIAGLDMTQYERTLAIVLRGVVLGTKHASAVMLRQGSGSIINTGSVAGSRAGYGPYDYCAAKAAVIHFTRCVAMELGEKGVRANSISPGGIVTPIFAKAMKLPAEQAGKAWQPLERALAKCASDPARRPARRHRARRAVPGERRRELRQRPRPRRGRWADRRSLVLLDQRGSRGHGGGAAPRGGAGGALTPGAPPRRRPQAEITEPNSSHPLSGPAVQLQRADRVEVGGAGAELDARQQHRQFQTVQVRRLLHDVLARQLVAALLQHLHHASARRGSRRR